MFNKKESLGQENSIGAIVIYDDDNCMTKALESNNHPQHFSNKVSHNLSLNLKIQPIP